MQLAQIVTSLVIAASLASGVQVYGTVFDASLEPVSAIVEINPLHQAIAARNGGYQFNVEPNRNYTLTAKSINGTALEERTIIQVGEQDAHFDIVLLTPAGFENETTELTETAGDLGEGGEEIALNDSVPSYWVLIAVIIAFIAAALLLSRHPKVKKIIYKNKNKAEKPTDNQITTPELKLPKLEGTALTESQSKTSQLDHFKVEILKIIRDKGGAIEQKELRRELPWSEARVSVELSELEKMGKVKKIKTGRANLVKLI